MGPVSFVMVLIGCSQNAQCAPITTLPVAYNSRTSCLEARGEILAGSGDMGYANVRAECRVSVPASASGGLVPSGGVSDLS
jgi:hypothetical protein